MPTPSYPDLPFFGRMLLMLHPSKSLLDVLRPHLGSPPSPPIFGLLGCLPELLICRRMIGSWSVACIRRDGGTRRVAAAVECLALFRLSVQSLVAELGGDGIDLFVPGTEVFSRRLDLVVRRVPRNLASEYVAA